MSLITSPVPRWVWSVPSTAFWSFPFSQILCTKLLSKHRTFIYETFIFRRSHRQFNNLSVGEKEKKNRWNSQGLLEKPWGMQCLELKHQRVSSSGCSSSIRDALQVSPTKSGGSTQRSSVQPLTLWQMGSRGRFSKPASCWERREKQDRGGKEKTGRLFSINGRKEGNGSFLSRVEKQVTVIWQWKRLIKWP